MRLYLIRSLQNFRKRPKWFASIEGYIFQYQSSQNQKLCPVFFCRKEHKKTSSLLYFISIVCQQKREQLWREKFVVFFLEKRRDTGNLGFLEVYTES